MNFADLTQIFADRRESLYIDTCCHFNRLGNEVMGQYIARVIADDGTVAE